MVATFEKELKLAGAGLSGNSGKLTSSGKAGTADLPSDVAGPEPGSPKAADEVGSADKNKGTLTMRGSTPKPQISARDGQDKSMASVTDRTLRLGGKKRLEPMLSKLSKPRSPGPYKPKVPLLRGKVDNAAEAKRIELITGKLRGLEQAPTEKEVESPIETIAPPGQDQQDRKPDSRAEIHVTEAAPLRLPADFEVRRQIAVLEAQRRDIQQKRVALQERQHLLEEERGRIMARMQELHEKIRILNQASRVARTTLPVADEPHPDKPQGKLSRKGAQRKRSEDRTQQKSIRRRAEVEHRRASPMAHAIEGEELLRRLPRKKKNKGGEDEAGTALVIARDIVVPDNIMVNELAHRLSVKASVVITRLMSDLGLMCTINHSLNQETAAYVVEALGHRPQLVYEEAIEHAHEATLEITTETGEKVPRNPVVTVMGHTDHGKTTLLDHIRKTRVAEGEAGGITQHIGAYQVLRSNGAITLLDTPGHAAFSGMRARGADLTDIVILVVAADDGVNEQTEEAIQHAKSADVPIVVAINKIDKENADADSVRRQLMQFGLVPDDLGGDTQFVNISALKGQGIEELLETVELQAEIMELRVVPSALGRGVVIESRLDRDRGSVATLLVQDGILHQGDVVVAGTCWGRVRAMHDERGKLQRSAGPSVPIEVLGLGAVPEAGEKFAVVKNEKKARELVEHRRDRQANKARMVGQRNIAEDFFHAEKGEKVRMKILVKADTKGSLEAINQAIHVLNAKDNTTNAQINLIGGGVGGVNESDVNLASTSQAMIFGFNVRADAGAKRALVREGAEIHYYSVIFNLLDDLKSMLADRMTPETREEILGIAEVREVFQFPKFGRIAGCMITEGSMFRNKTIRVLRDDVVIYQGELESLRRFEKDVEELRAGLECGIGVRNYKDVRVGDKIEVYEIKEVARST